MSENEENQNEDIQRVVNQIINESRRIDKNAIAREILTWLVNNVENYIDNSQKVFKIDLHLPFYVEEMKETYALQELFKKIPDDSESVSVELEGDPTMGMPDLDSLDKAYAREALGEYDEALAPILECREHLNKIVEDVHSIIGTEENLRAELFKKMIYYYELSGMKDGELIVKKLEGLAEITSLEYDSFSMGVSVTPKEVRDQEGNILSEAGDTVSYTIPESFTLVLEISFREKIKAMSTLF